MNPFGFISAIQRKLFEIESQNAPLRVTSLTESMCTKSSGTVFYYNKTAKLILILMCEFTKVKTLSHTQSQKNWNTQSVCEQMDI